MYRSTNENAAWRTTRAVVAGATALAAFGVGFAPSAAAEEQAATTFVVTSPLDERDVDVVDDICDSDPSPGVRCTLRAAVMQANVSPGTFVIQLPPQLYQLTIPGAGEDQSRSGDLDLTGNIEIVGTTVAGVSKRRAVIDARGASDRAVDGRSSAAALRNVVITGGILGTTSGLSTQLDGGGVRTFGNFTISDSVVRGNTASRGGGIASFNGTLTVTRTLVSDNSATAVNTGLVTDGGGGMFIINTSATVLDSTIERNTSNSSGGGIGVAPVSIPEPGIKVVRSLVAGNTAAKSGGGIDAVGTNGGSFKLDNSTVSGNDSGSHGGGVAIRRVKQDNKISLFESTIAGNSAVGFYGGVSTDDSAGGRASAYGVIFANNAPANCDAGSSFGLTGSRNLSTDTICRFSDSGSITGVSARLGSLANNGGPTRTHALLPDSPAIDAAGYPLPGFSFDQRGKIRIRQGLSINNPHDMGAVESNPLGG